MSLAQPFRVGRFQCHLLEGGRQHLDGGAMFGVVPKPLWETRIAPDARNRIPLALRCLLIEHDDGLILVDTGVGNKESERFHGIFGIENGGQSGRTQLEDALKEAGFVPDDIKYVINTHLHFDHAGGNTCVDKSEGQEAPEAEKAADSGSQGPSDPPAVRLPVRPRADPPIRLTFPNAIYVVQRGELEYASRTNERTAASYFPRNFAPVAAERRWNLVDGQVDFLPGIRLLHTPGHVPHHQSVLVHDGPDVACFVADLVPTSAHIPLPWIMGYDVEPLVTLESKRKLLGEAHREGWLLLFEHDPNEGFGRVGRDSKSFIYQRLDTP